MLVTASLKIVCILAASGYRNTDIETMQGVAWKDGGVFVDLVQSYHQAGDSASTHVSSTERLHESEVERRSPILHVLEVWVDLENLSIVQHFSQ